MKKLLLTLLCVSLLISGLSRSLSINVSASALLDSQDPYGQAFASFLSNPVPSYFASAPFLFSENMTPIFVNSIEEMTDTTRLYVLDGMIYQYREVSVPIEPVNALTQYGYLTNTRLKSNGTTTAASTACATEFIPVQKNDVIHVSGWQLITGTSCYICLYDQNKQLLKCFWLPNQGTRIIAANWLSVDYDGAGFNVTLSASSLKLTESNEAALVDKIAYMRISGGTFDGNETIYINKHLQHGTTTEYQWVNTGTSYIPESNDQRIDTLEDQVAENEEKIEHILDIIERDHPDLPLTRQEALKLMKEWNKPLYENSDAVLIGNDKNAITSNMISVETVYAAYDALMDAYPAYITKTLLGMASDGRTPIYRYDFCAPKPHEYSGGTHPEIQRPKAILVSGIHAEWTGIWSLYFALESIIINPAFRDIRRNVHLIVVPMVNPYCLYPENYEKTNGRQNANGVEIHRNFAVEHEVISSSSVNYGGPAPLSEVETQYIDAILKANSDAAFFLSAHSFGANEDKDFGTSFIWASVATDYMYNLSGRFVVKMSEAWEYRYEDTFRKGVDALRTPLQPAGDYTVGMVGVSTTPGTEAKHCMLYGIHALTLEVSANMAVMGYPTNSAATVTRGAEVYANFIKTAFENYDPNDKKEYAPVLGINMTKALTDDPDSPLR